MFFRKGSCVLILGFDPIISLTRCVLDRVKIEMTGGTFLNNLCGSWRTWFMICDWCVSRFVACDRNCDWWQRKTQLWRQLLNFGIRMFVKSAVSGAHVDNFLRSFKICVIETKLAFFSFDNKNLQRRKIVGERDFFIQKFDQVQCLSHKRDQKSALPDTIT